MKSKVYPTSETSLVIIHPIDGPLRVDGSDWEVDGFTARMLVDHAITSDPNEAWKKQVSAKEAPPPKEQTK